MARLHIDVGRLAAEFPLALEVLAHGGDVLLERDGAVVAELVLPAATRGEGRSDRPSAAFAGGPSLPPFEPGGNAANVAMDLLRTQATHAQSMEMWDELSREEELLEYLASELD